METTISTFTDSRDGKTYKTVKIGEQVWMAENLAFECEGAKCYDNNPENAVKYGLLYDWETAKKAVPAGWHLPTKDEWLVLVNFVDGGEVASTELKRTNVAGAKLKATNGWTENGNGTDDFGFAALPGGCIGINGSFDGIGIFDGWWLATERDVSNAYCGFIGYNNDHAGLAFQDKTHLSSVRCVKD